MPPEEADKGVPDIARKQRQTHAETEKEGDEASPGEQKQDDVALENETALLLNQSKRRLTQPHQI